MSFVNLNYHLVFGTRDRRPLIQPSFRERLYQYLGGIIRQQDGRLIEIGGMPDHVHILASLHQTKDIAGFVRTLKSNSSRWSNQVAGIGSVLKWQTKYGAFTVSQSQIPRLVKYLQNQEKHHQKKTFREEFVAFLEKHDVHYKPEYLFE